MASVRLLKAVLATDPTMASLVIAQRQAEVALGQAARDQPRLWALEHRATAKTSVPALRLAGLRLKDGLQPRRQRRGV